MSRRLSREEYAVGWVCALPVELAAAKAMLDEEHETARDDDNNLYCMGSIAGHNVVIVCLPAGRIGNNPATAVATQMQAVFKGIRFGLMVGIGGGVPSAEADVRLGDVVVSHPERTFGGVVQYDLGKSMLHGFRRIGSLNAPPQILLSAVNNVRANEMLGKTTLSEHMSTIERIPAFQRPRARSDVLFNAGYKHQPGPTCDQCSIDRQQSRPQRNSGAEVTVHYGTIASGNQVIKNATKRDKISAQLDGVLCFEMEAAGLMDTYPCLVIRGICDYADSHKNKQWQPYAAGTAAAYAKELLTAIPAVDVIRTRRVEDAMRSGTSKRNEGAAVRRTYMLMSPQNVISNLHLMCPLLRSAANKTVSVARKVISHGPTAYPPMALLTRALPTATDSGLLRQRQSQPPINDEQKRTLLESLKFDQIDARQLTIKPAHAKTCKWLLKSSQYGDWLDASKVNEHHGFLWIKGKAGAGKSTLMKFVTANARKTMKECTVLSFFFNARGEDIEKSPIGTYRSLLLQLLEAVPESQNILNPAGIPASTLNGDQQWSIELLRTLLEQAIQTLGESSVVCFIDALDECEEQQVREMIRFLEHIADIAVSNGVHLKVCFSSRHYPHVTIRNGLELVLEGQEGHAQDITNYIETELKIGKSKAAQRIRSELQEKASGVFMWVVLVVDMLNKQFDRGQVHALRRKLQEIPGDLHELFRDILTRDSHDKELLVLCIQWVLFTKQPLSPEQLYHALLSSIDPGAVLESDPEDITRDDMKRYILNSSKGLTEATAAKDPKIQFIHESVRDFLLKENGLSKVWPEFEHNFPGQSHERLKQCCYDHFQLAAASSLKIPDDFSEVSAQQAGDLRTTATQILPFLEYAVHNVLYHADKAEGSGISQAGFLASFSIPQWVKIDNLFEKHKVRRHTESVNLLYLLAELNTANLIKTLDSASQCMDVGTERYGCPLFAAAAMSNEEILKLLIVSVGLRQDDSSPQAAVNEYIPQHKSFQGSSRRNFVYSKSKSFLMNAIDLGHEELFALLFRSERDVDVRESTALLWRALQGGLEVVARLCLSASPAIANSKNREDESALYFSAKKGDKTMLQILLDNGADVNAQRGPYGNTLQAASARGNKEIVELLLAKGADVNAQGGLHGNALQAASHNAHKEIVELLLAQGADVNAQGGYYSNTLQAASAHGYKEIVELLLAQGADVNAQGDYGNALQAASARGYKEIVELLLAQGADVNAQGENYSNALQAASLNGYKEIVELLLAQGADVNAQGGEYGNALRAASVRGHKDIVLLLEKWGASEIRT